MFTCHTDGDTFCRKAETVGLRRKAKHHGQTTLGGTACKKVLKLLVAVTVKRHARPQVGRHLVGEQTVADSTIDAKPL